MRQAVRAYRGHFYLWLWGGIWIAMALSVHFFGDRGIRLLPLFILVGVAGSYAIGYVQSSHIRSRLDQRFLRALACILGFGLIWPSALGVTGPNESMRVFAFIALLVMQAYVLAGIWFDNYLLAIGLAVSGLILLGLFVFPGIFWLWFAVFCGGSVVLSGFVVRYLWR